MFDKSCKMWRDASVVKSRDVNSHTEASLGFEIRYAHKY